MIATVSSTLDRIDSEDKHSYPIESVFSQATYRSEEHISFDLRKLLWDDVLSNICENISEIDTFDSVDWDDIRDSLCNMAEIKSIYHVRVIYLFNELNIWDDEIEVCVPDTTWLNAARDAVYHKLCELYSRYFETIYAECDADYQNSEDE